MLAAGARAELAEINVAQQYGISYLPLMLMEEQKLIEKHAKAAGVDVKVGWAKFAGGNVMNDALLSGSLQFASGGVGPLITLWSRTKGNLDVKAVSAINSMPLYLNTRNPNVKTIKDFTEKDKIALPAVKVSIQAVTLQMAAEKAFGEGQHGKLDPLTVSLSHPDAQTALLSGAGEITAHFSSPPFQYQQLEKPGIRTVLNSLRGAGRAGDVQPGVDDVEVPQRESEALRRVREGARRGDRADQRQQAGRGRGVPAHQPKDKDTLDDIVKMLNDPQIVYTTTPQNMMKYVAFMGKIGSIKVKPDSWKDMFFPNAHGLPGS